MATKYLGIVLGFVFVFTSCRYKDNDKFVVSTVKHRIEKTWYMKKCTVNEIVYEDFIADLSNNTLTFLNVKKDKFIMYPTSNGDNGGEIGGAYTFKKNKTEFTSDGISNEYNLKITKLTKDELWIEGDRIMNTLGGFLTDKIKARFSSKK